MFEISADHCKDPFKHYIVCLNPVTANIAGQLGLLK